MTDENRSGKTLTRRKLLKSGTAAAAAGIAGCMGGGDEESWDKPEKTPLPLDTDTPTQTETETETENPKAKFPLSYEQIIENTYIQDPKKWHFSPVRADNYKKNFDNTSILITETIRRARENERNDPNQTLSLHEMMPHNRTYIHGKEHLDFTYDDITIARRLSQGGQEVLHGWDNTGNKELHFVMDPRGYDKDVRDEMILRENEEHLENSSIQRALNAYIHGDPSMNPLGVEQTRDLYKDPDDDNMTVEETLANAEETGRIEENTVREILEYTEFELPTGETVDATNVDITFDWNIGNQVLELSKDREFFTQGTEYVHNVAAFTDTQKVMFGFADDIKSLEEDQLGEFDDKYNDLLPEDYSIKQEIGEVAGETVMAAPVTEDVYNEAVEDLYKPEELLEKAS